MLNRVGSLVTSSGLILCFLWFVTAKDAHAYIDLGSGSFLFQILLATLFASLFMLRVFWQRFNRGMTKFLSYIRGQSNTQPPER